METVNEIKLSISEPQDVNELNAEELEAVAGGAGIWGDIIGIGLDILGLGGSDEKSSGSTSKSSSDNHSSNGNVTVHC